MQSGPKVLKKVCNLVLSVKFPQTTLTSDDVTYKVSLLFKGGV